MTGGRTYLTLMILVVMFLDLLGLIKATFGIEGIFIWQLFLTVVFMIAGISVMYMLLRQEAVFSPYIFFSAILVNAIYLYFLTGGSFMLFFLALLTIIGMLVSLNIVKTEKPKDRDFYEAKDIVKDIQMEPSETKYSVVETYEPGKYVASRNASYYHAPKCDWAEKINARNRVWLQSDEEAKKKGYKKHNCLR